MGRAAIAAVSGFVGACSAYLALLSVAAVARSRRSVNASPVDGDLVFVVLVPAHDERAVIDRTIRAMRALDYPSASFSIHVVADNCSDDTAAVARSAGATVHERTDPAARGKGPALNWLLGRVGPSDAVAIVDADTVVDPAFLTEMARALDAGADVAQGRYDVLDDSTSPATAIRAAALACRHHLRPLGRNELGGSCGLYGNGMVFRRHVLDGRRWSGHLVEDAELQNELLLDEIVVHYVPTAGVAAEMPESLASSSTQHERWELGRLQVARTFIPPLLRSAATRPRHRTAHLDAVADHLVPPLSVLVAANAVATTVGVLGLAGRRSRLHAFAGAGAGVAIVAHVLVGLQLAGAPRSTYRALLSAPRLVVWKLALLARVALRPGSVVWTRTTRNDTSTPVRGAT
ncbi:glycosyltransferase family 2 protein [Ilumatobacter coccineus]|uniref:Putative glycosyltransferase n=1 Tax=Ilumatobacter coccineus (strain NBRC 103263 / KCTC 29153 / YM16-304) TaxID=1313172 RepID=A0A6C7E5M4_ILUCY|nr:glycosyltransferase family 2 protein [Ilumatobacter coccineus]BAN01763.1 putative glycosyltransferase [Ilumatobacter coccineus YM16-304]